MVSTDGKTIAVTTKLLGEKPTTVISKMKRLSAPSGSSSLLGGWRHARESSSVRGAQVTYTLAANGLHVKYEGPTRQEYTLVFDGKEHPVEGGSNDTFAARKSASAATKRNGRATGNSRARAASRSSQTAKNSSSSNNPAMHTVNPQCTCSAAPSSTRNKTQRQAAPSPIVVKSTHDAE